MGMGVGTDYCEGLESCDKLVFDVLGGVGVVVR
jgi:hypothetical protein